MMRVLWTAISCLMLEIACFAHPGGVDSEGGHWQTTILEQRVDYVLTEKKYHKHPKPTPTVTPTPSPTPTPESTPIPTEEPTPSPTPTPEPTVEPTPTATPTPEPTPEVTPEPSPTPYVTEPVVWFSSWQTGQNQPWGNKSALGPQLDRIGQGEYILPVFQHPIDGYGSSADNVSIARLASMNIAFSMRVNNAANHVTSTALITDWIAAGTKLGKATALLETQIPNPPLVIMLDNNEGAKAKAGTAAQFAAMHDAWNAELSLEWQAVVKHVGYGACYANHELGRGWWLPTDIRPAVETAWDGGSPAALYIHSWRTIENDTKVIGPQMFAINVAYGIHMRPNFWQEMGVWHGEGNTIATLGLTPQRYQGYVSFGIFVAQPRVIREFLGSTVPFTTYEPFTRALYKTVKIFNENPVVNRFWREGTEVISNQITPLYRDRQNLQDEQYRNRLLASADNPTTNTGEAIWPIGPEYIAVLKVFSAAKRIGNEFLLFAQCPKGPFDVRVNLVGYGQVTVNAAPEGNFYLISNGNIEHIL